MQTTATTAIYPTDPVKVTLADGQDYGLRFSMGSVRRIKAKFGPSLQKMLEGHPVEEILLFALQEGLTTKVTESKLEEELITGPMTEYLFGRFVEAFFSPSEREFWDVAKMTQAATLAKLKADVGSLTAKAVETTAAQIKTVN